MMSRSSVFLVSLAILLSVFKIFIIGQNEIVAVPYDAWGYVSLASKDTPWYELGPLPGYSIWLWACHFFGIPQRLAIELLLAACAFVFADGVGRRLGGVAGFLAVYFLAVFSPVTYHLFDLTLSDGFYCCLTIAVAGLVGRIITNHSDKPNLWLFVALGSVLGLMEITRRETPVSAFLISMLTLALVIRGLISGSSAKTAILSTTRQVTVCVVTAAIIPLTILVAHHSEQNVWALSTADVPSHMGLLKRLAAIQTDEQSRRFVPISTRARELAYANSPTLGRFRSHVEDPTSLYQRASAAALGYPREIGAGWIWHVFSGAAYELDISKPSELDATYQLINRELDAAFASGKLHKRFVLNPLIDPDFSVWISYLPGSLARVSLASIQAMYAVPDQWFDSGLFDQVGLRRSDLVRRKLGTVKGWAYIDNSEPGTISVTSSDSFADPTSLIGQVTRFPRPDVQEGYRKLGRNAPTMSGFSAAVREPDAAKLRVTVSLKDGRAVVSGPLRVGGVQTLEVVPGPEKVVIGIDEVRTEVVKTDVGTRGDFMDRGIGIYRIGVLWVLVVVIIGAALGLHIFRAVQGDRWSLTCALLIPVLMLWVLSRLFLYSIIDAAAWTAEPRYVMGTGFVLLGVATGSLASLFGKRDTNDRRVGLKL